MTGIFCLEGDWNRDFNRSWSVRPILDILRHGMERKVAIVHRNVATRAELAHYLRRWKRTRTYGLLYLGFHGDPGVLYLDDRHHDIVTLEDVASMLGAGLAGRLVHFGSCSTFAVDRRRVTRFLRRTGLTAATGFATDLPWLRSLSFELLMLSTLVERRVTLRNARRVRLQLRKDVPSLRREVAFRMVIND